VAVVVVLVKARAGSGGGGGPTTAGGSAICKTTVFREVERIVVVAEHLPRRSRPETPDDLRVGARLNETKMAAETDERRKRRRYTTAERMKILEAVDRWG
jgi:hypothetical protein